MMRNKLLIPIFLLSFATITLFSLFGPVNSALADTCVPAGQSCPAGEDSDPASCSIPAVICGSSGCVPEADCSLATGSCHDLAGTMCSSSGGGGGGGGPGVGSIDLPIPDLGELTANLMQIAFFGAALFFLAQMIIGGIMWTNAGGDPKALEAARNRLTNAMIGLLIVVSSFALTLIITTVLGINIFQVGGITIN